MKVGEMHMNMSSGFGVEQEGPRSWTLLLVVMRRGKNHKDNLTMDKQVAVWPHVKNQLSSI
jgi:hypothetical protein